MGKIVDIDGKDEFTFLGMTYCYADCGEARLHVNYQKDYGGDYVLKLEAYAEGEEMRASPKITYANFRRRYPKHRIYLGGCVKIGYSDAETV